MWKIQTGNHLEAAWSKYKGQADYFPVLISSKLLRSHQCGQVDLAFIKNNHLIIYEVKSAGHLSKKQKQRLYGSATLLSYFLGMNARVEILTGDPPR